MPYDAEKAWRLKLADIQAREAISRERAAAACPGSGDEVIKSIAEADTGRITCRSCGREFKARVTYGERNEPWVKTPYHKS